MRFAAPLAAPHARAAGFNPVAKLGAVAVLTAGALATTDPVTPAVLLVAVLAVLPFTGLRPGALLRRGWPLLAGALSVGLVNAVFADRQTGVVIVHYGPFGLSTGGLLAGLGMALRVLAIALPGVLTFASTDPTALADALIQQLRVPARFAIGALAAYRLLPVLADEWELLVLARRARGVDAGRNPVARLRLAGGTLFALLVGAVRRAGRLSVAMDARGFGTVPASTPRTVARPQRFRRADLVLVLVTALVTATALAAGALPGVLRPLFG